MSNRARVRVGVDVGGTFTDVCYLDESRQSIQLEKLPTTPSDQSIAIAEGVARVIAAATSASGALPDIVGFAHGTTVATNALIEGTGCRVALVTTAGFRDILEIGRQRRSELYNLYEVKRPAIAPRHLRFELVERLAADGSVITPLDETSLESVIGRLREAHVDSVAVCLLHSYVNPEHERTAAERIRAALPGVFVTESSDVSPEFREYERVSTTVVNAYLGPRMDSYLGNLGHKLEQARVSAVPYVVQSNGGVVSFDDARRHPVKTVLSGPSAGVMGAAHVARTAGRSHVATLDMGGTSADVALITQGEARIRPLVEVLGHPLRTQMVDMSTVGAGGGSIAWIDTGGRLKVGPRSAGADPGPACYGRSPDAEPTVTDANLVLGYLGAGGLLGGEMKLDREAAVRAIESIAEPLGLTVAQAAAGIVAVANASMVNAIRIISVRKGIDLRDYSLVAFGGAGPLHSSAVARELGIAEVIIPPTPGVLCALGALVTDARRDFAVTQVVDVDGDPAGTIAQSVAKLEREAQEWIARESSGEPAVIRHSVDARYRGQNHELTVPLSSGEIGDGALADLISDFHELHRARYGYALEDEVVQAVTFRVEATLPSGLSEVASAKPALPRVAPSAPSATRRAWFGHGADLEADSPVYSREVLPQGFEVSGPAIIEQMDTTVLIEPGEVARVDAYGNLIITTGAQRDR